ncbi:PTCB-BRCT domain protein [Ceratobasidium sp. AG-Ba]|nr:PTCB-BRCT domain protein [Ceratobasidium sp. AG-Ba]QRW10399.1 PTCB-BRCT domain protein [Ceratobasidium sp. AG-Ba]
MGEEFCDSPTVKTKRFIGVEYAGRKGLIQRNPSYEASVEFVRIAFKALQGVPISHIAISAYIEEFDDTLELSEHVWEELLPELKFITVTLVGPSAETSEPEEAILEPEYESASGDGTPADAPTDLPPDPPEEPPADPPEDVPEDVPEDAPGDPPADPPEEPAEGGDAPEDSAPPPEPAEEPEIPGGFPACDDEPVEDVLPFADIVLCFTGMGSRSRITLFEKAEALGAICDNNLTNRTTHLVAAIPEGPKYQWALKLKLPVLSVDWIPNAHAKWLAGEPVDRDESIRTHLLIPPEDG